RVIRRQARYRDVAPRSEMIQPHLPLRTEHRDDHHLHRPAITALVPDARADARETSGNQQGSQNGDGNQAVWHRASSLRRGSVGSGASTCPSSGTTVSLPPLVGKNSIAVKHQRELTRSSAACLR